MPVRQLEDEVKKGQRNVLTLEEVAQRVRVPLATCRYWRATGSGPPTFRVGRHVVAFEDAVEAWLEQQAAQAS